MSTGTSGSPNANSSTQAAVLRPTPGSAVRYVARLGDRQLGQERQVRRVRQRAQDLLDPDRLLAVQAAGLDRRLDLGGRDVADLLPAREASAQAHVGDVAVAVVGRLREHGEDQLLDPVAVRRRQRPAVEQPQPVAQRAHPARRRAGPVGARDGGGAGAHAAPARCRFLAARGIVSIREASQTAAPPRSLWSAAATDRGRRQALARKLGGSSTWGLPTGEDQRRIPAMRTALLACSVVICCCAVLAWQPAKASADGGHLDRDRAQGHPDRQPDPRPSWAAAPEGEPPARPRGDRAHGRHARAVTS